MSVLTLDLIKNSGPKHQQHWLRTWHPESSQCADFLLDFKTSSILCFFHSSPRLQDLCFIWKKKHFARLCNSPVTLHLSTPREALPSSWINFSHDSLKAAVIPAVCALFLPHFSLEVSYPRISLSTALCNSQPFLPCPCGRCQWSLSGELSSQQLGCVCMYWTRLRDRHYLYCVNSISLKMKSIFFFIKTWNISLYIWWM